MGAFVIAERTDVKDPERLGLYLDQVSRTIEQFGGRYHVVSSSVEVLEGGWRPATLVVFEFPSREQALAWWGSDEYRPLKELRRKSATYNVVLADGTG